MPGSEDGLRNGKNGSFWGCSDYSMCRAPADDDSKKPVFSGSDTMSLGGGRSFMFQSTMPEARRKEIGRQVADAMKFGNKDLAIKLSMQIPLDLPTARVLKADWGVERLKNFGFNLDDVVAAYGKEWLEQ